MEITALGNQIIVLVIQGLAYAVLTLLICFVLAKLLGVIR